MGAFAFCEKLISIDIPDGVTIIESYAFQGCISLTNITIPQGITSIEYGTFMDCKGLTRIEIPDSVKYIFSYAFAYCDRFVINYSGTRNQWGTISKFSDWDRGTKSYTVYCNDGNYW